MKARGRLRAWLESEQAAELGGIVAALALFGLFFFVLAVVLAAVPEWAR